MQKRKLIFAVIIPVLALSVVAFKGYDIKNGQPLTNQTVINLEHSYDADVVKPEFLKNNSDIAIIGKISDKKTPVKGNYPANSNNEVIYTDTHIKVEKVIMDKTNNQIKPGDTLTVRNIGGTVGNVTMETDTNDVLKNDKKDKKVLLFLADITKDLSIPQDNVQANTFAIVGSFNGSFVLSSDGLEATRDVSGDKFKANDLVNLFNNK